MRTITYCLALALTAGTAVAGPATGPAPTLPKTGDTLTLAGNADWPKLVWLYDSPSGNDAAGKIVIHWFCATSQKTCKDDLARMINQRDTGHVYIVAYINGSVADAKRLDPIRESEGVGRGTVAYGPTVTKLVKQLGVTSYPTSIVVDTDGKIKTVTTSGDINELDSRDSIISGLVANIKDFTSAATGITSAKANDKFTLAFKIQLAPWLSFSTKSQPDVTFTTPKEVKCAKDTKVEGHTLTLSANCSGPHGNYEAAANVRFNYDIPGSTAVGTGTDGTKWKFDIQ